MQNNRYYPTQVYIFITFDIKNEKKSVFILYCPHLIVTVSFARSNSRSTIKMKKKSVFILYCPHLIVTLHFVNL